MNTNSISHTPVQFTEPSILKEIGYTRLVKFLELFSDEFSSELRSLLATLTERRGVTTHREQLDSPPSNDLIAVAAALGSPDLPPKRLRAAMHTIEVAASPENQARTDEIIQRRIPCVSVNPSCALDRALEIWFVAPDELEQFTAAEPPTSAASAPFSIDDLASPLPPIQLSSNPPIQKSINPFLSPPSSIQNPESSIHSPPPTNPPIQQSSLHGLGDTEPSIQNHPAPGGTKFKNENNGGPTYLTFPEIQLGPGPVNGKLLLDALRALLIRFVVLPKWAAEALALWILHTYCFRLRDVTTYIGLESPEHRCGKSTLVTVLSELVHRPLVSSNISPPAFFRVIEDFQPTLFIDEADTFLPGNEQLKGILNSGYTRKTAFVLRAANQSSIPPSLDPHTGPAAIPAQVSRFSCWCPKLISRIGRLPVTLADRCIIVRMERKTPDEQCERLRNLDTLALRGQCARFAHDHSSAIAQAEPELSRSLNDRAADIWEPLLAIADLAGGDWPELARQAALHLSASAQDNNPLSSLLLDVFLSFLELETDRLFTRDLLERLNGFTGRAWAELRNGKEITDLWLSQQLRRYGIRPTTLRIGEMRAKGYFKEDFRDACRRYVSKSDLNALLGDPEDNDLPPAPGPKDPS